MRLTLKASEVILQAMSSPWAVRLEMGVEPERSGWRMWLLLCRKRELQFVVKAAKVTSRDV